MQTLRVLHSRSQGVRDQAFLVVTVCRNIQSGFPRFPAFSGHEIRIPSHPEMRLIILKRNPAIFLLVRGFVKATAPANDSAENWTRVRPL